MAYGYSGKILVVDLSSGVHQEQELSDIMIKRYVGGRGWGSLLLGEMVSRGTEPLRPGNSLLFLTGPITGTPAPGGSKYVVVTKSPVSGGFCDSYSSGRLALEMKAAGYDGIAIKGKAKEPSVLSINDRKIEILPARDLWGQDTFQTETFLKGKFGEDSGTACIGPAGENLVAFASINSDYFRQAARGGVGAVMGSKNLKAVVVRGTGGVRCYDGRRLVEMVKEYKARLTGSDQAQRRMKYGTPLTLNITNSLGMLPTRNFQESVFPEATGEIDGDGFLKNVIRHRGCIGCLIACSKISRVEKGEFAGDTLEGPEYETLAMLGSNLGVANRAAVIRANLVCDRLGLDTISAGNALGFLMECFEKGFMRGWPKIDRELKFGDYRFGIELLHRIAYRRGIGDLLADGVRLAARKIGQGAEDFAMQTKGLEFPAYDPRAGYGIALAYAVSPRGACHRRAWPPRIELLGNLPPDTIEGKPEIVKEMFDENAIFHSLLVCDFPCKMAPLKVKDFAEYLQVISGIPFSESDLWSLADRTETRIRLFNLREGLRRAEDTLPRRIFEEALPGGPRKGARIHREQFERMLKSYYRLRGWDEEGIPLPETLQKLALPSSEDYSFPGKT